MMTRRSLLQSLPFTPLSASSTVAQTGPSGMKITRFVIHKAMLRWRQLLFLEIHTNSGLVGIGEGSIPRRATIVEEALRWLEPRMAGQDPAGVERHWDRNYYELSRWRAGSILMTALAAIDIALHDLEGKRLGVPVWRLLGGPIRSELRVYHTHWDTAAGAREKSPEQIAEAAAGTKSQGWTAMKFSVPRHPNEEERRRRAVEMVGAVRKGAGEDFDIGLELYESFSVRSALQLAHAIAPYRPMFLEEPYWRENAHAFTELAAKSPVPIATGEGHLSRHEFRPLLEARGAQIVQPDVLHCGGITELRKIANLAETYGVEVAPHQCYGPIGHVASLHAMSVCRNFFIQEWEAQDDPLYMDLTKGAYPTQKNGHVPLPEGPGLGIGVNFKELTERFPYRDVM